MTVPRLRELAKKLIGPGQSRLKTKTDLVAALERAGAAAAAPAARAKAAVARAAEAAGAPVRAAKAAAAKVTARAGGKAKAPAAARAKPPRPAPGETEPEPPVAAAKAKREPSAPKAAPAKAGAKAAGKAKPGVAGKVGAAVAAAAEGLSRALGGKRRRKGEGAPDPEGYFVARVRGEEAVRDAPHPMTETTPDGEEEFHGFAEAPAGAAVHDEALGELPWGYADDAFVALPRDPRTLFLYWDLAQETTARAFAGLEGGRAELRVFARAGEGWERVKVVDFALESRGFYVHDLEPGRIYRAEIHAVDRGGRDRLVVNPSNEMVLPAVGPSPLVDDRFLRLPWDVPLGALLGPGRKGGAFSEEARAMLARLSDWGRFHGRTWGVSSAGGMGGRPAGAEGGEAAARPWSPSGGGR